MLTVGPKISSIAPATTDIANKKNIDTAPIHAMVDVEVEDSWFFV